MQSPKGRLNYVEASKKTSIATPRTSRNLIKTQGSDNELGTSPTSKTLKDRSAKILERRSPQTPASEKKRPVRSLEVESQLIQLQNNLKKTKDQFRTSDSLKQKAQNETEEAKRQLAAMSKKLEETQKQLENLSDSEQVTLQELRKISQERDRAWQSELEAVQNQNCMDSFALASAMNEIQRLRVQLDRAAGFEVEIENLRMQLTGNLSLVDELNSHITNIKESEAQALEEIRKAQMQLQMAKITEETMQSEIFKASEAYKSLAFELKKAQNRMSTLEEIIVELQAVRSNTDQALLGSANNFKQESGEDGESDQHKTEPINLKLEAEQLRTELEVAERGFQEENIQGILQSRSAYEVVERIKEETCEREAEWEAKLEIAIADASKFKNGMMAKELQLQNISEENKGLSRMFEESQSTETVLIIELEKSKTFLTEFMASLLDKETMLNGITEENHMLKLELARRELESSKLNGEAVVVTKAVSAFDQEALVKLGHVTDETDQSTTKAANNVTELLDASQTTNSELEAELRKLKVQADQWRKAAEAAATMLSTGNTGKYMERTGSLEYHALGGKFGSPYSEDMDEESPKKKNGNMLKKISTLLKKK